MRVLVSAIFACCIIALLLVAGCADVNVQKKALDFGTAFGGSSEEQKAIDWFKDKYGDPIGNTGPARFVEPLITSGLTDKRLPVDKVTTFPVSGGSVYFFVIYDNFNKGDPITVTWTYLENGKEITNIQQQAGGDFGRFIAEIQKPDSGWGRGKQRITITGDGANASVNFTIGDTLQTTPLPYSSAGGQGSAGIPGSTVAKPGIEKPITELPSRGVSGMVTTAAVASTDLSSDPKNCGSTGMICPTVFAATSTCSGGKCGFTCKTNNADCNQNPSDGCEQYLGVADNCGACGNVCRFNHGWGDCSDSLCVLSRCDDGWYDCNQNPADGCETDIATGHDNCGGCGRKCQESESCQDSHCVYSCTGSKTSCKNSCVDLTTDLHNCGSCGHRCHVGIHAFDFCINSKCNGDPGATLLCQDGYASCDGNNQNGCETTIFDNDNCGACGHKCIEPFEHCAVYSQGIINVDYWPYTLDRSEWSCTGNI